MVTSLHVEEALLAYRELDDALGLTEMAGETLADARTGRNGRHALVGLQQSNPTTGLTHEASRDCTHLGPGW